MPRSAACYVELPKQLTSLPPSMTVVRRDLPEGAQQYKAAAAPLEQRPLVLCGVAPVTQSQLIHPANMLVPVTAPKNSPTHCGPIAQHILAQIASEIPPLVTMMSGRKIFRTPSPSLTPI